MLRPFPARLEPRVYDAIKRRSEAEHKSMNTVLNESLERQFAGVSDVRAALLHALAVLDENERRSK